MPYFAGAFCFDDAGKAFGISPALLEAIARTESNMNPKALNRNTNGTIDMGLMQINSSWVKPLALKPSEIMSDPCYNTFIGARILRQCIDRHGNSWEAVGCYNATKKQKRVDYSWKVYKRITNMIKDAEAVPEKDAVATNATSAVLASDRREKATTDGPYLFFRVRE